MYIQYILHFSQSQTKKICTESVPPHSISVFLESVPRQYTFLLLSHIGKVYTISAGLSMGICEKICRIFLPYPLDKRQWLCYNVATKRQGCRRQWEFVCGFCFGIRKRQGRRHGGLVYLPIPEEPLPPFCIKENVP